MVTLHGTIEELALVLRKRTEKIEQVLKTSSRSSKDLAKELESVRCELSLIIDSIDSGTITIEKKE